MHLTRPVKVLKIYEAYSGIHSPLTALFDEMFLAADSDERKRYRRLLDTRLFYDLYG